MRAPLWAALPVKAVLCPRYPLPRRPLVRGRGFRLPSRRARNSWPWRMRTPEQLETPPRREIARRSSSIRSSIGPSFIRGESLSRRGSRARARLGQILRQQSRRAPDLRQRGSATAPARRGDDHRTLRHEFDLWPRRLRRCGEQGKTPASDGGTRPNSYIWGVRDSEYLVLPIVGPTTTRDLIGSTVEFVAMLPVNFWGPAGIAAQARELGFAGSTATTLTTGVNISGSTAGALSKVDKAGDLETLEASSLDFYVMLESVVDFRSGKRSSGRLWRRAAGRPSPTRERWKPFRRIPSKSLQPATPPMQGRLREAPCNEGDLRRLAASAAFANITAMFHSRERKTRKHHVANVNHAARLCRHRARLDGFSSGSQRKRGCGRVAGERLLPGAPRHDAARQAAWPQGSLRKARSRAVENL